MRETSSIESGLAFVGSRLTSHLKPSWTPRTSKPSLIALIVAEEMTALMPGAGPPPTRIANLPADDIYPSSPELRSRDVRLGGKVRSDSTGEDFVWPDRFSCAAFRPGCRIGQILRCSLTDCLDNSENSLPGIHIFFFSRCGLRQSAGRSLIETPVD